MVLAQAKTSAMTEEKNSYSRNVLGKILENGILGLYAAGNSSLSIESIK
jgi:hypothetical protein